MIDIGDREDPHVQARVARERPLLLHSLSLFSEVFASLFAVLEPIVVVEVGVESGSASAGYLQHGAREVYCVEPAPTPQVRWTVAENPDLHLIDRPSPEALAIAPRGDVYVLDGDHNYATVRAEVDWILTNAPDAVIVLHDVLWPSGRRDQYYNPDAELPGTVHPHSDDGATIWHDELTPAGFVGRGAFTTAIDAGGERNGVLTAVEDAISAHHRPVELAFIPVVFGLAVAYPADSEITSRVRRHLAPYDRSPLLMALENNRIALYTRVLANQYDLSAIADHADQLTRQLTSALDRQRLQQDEIEALRRREEHLIGSRQTDVTRRNWLSRMVKVGRRLISDRRL